MIEILLSVIAAEIGLLVLFIGYNVGYSIYNSVVYERKVSREHNDRMAAIAAWSKKQTEDPQATPPTPTKSGGNYF